MTEDQTAQLLLQMAQSSRQLTGAVATLATSQASFMRSAADADVNIGLSKSHPFIHTEGIAARDIDNTVDDLHRSGLPASERDTNPPAPVDYASDHKSTEYDANSDAEVADSAKWMEKLTVAVATGRPRRRRRLKHNRNGS